MKTIMIFALSLFSYTSFTQTAIIRQKHFNTENKLAIKGYDPVAYFKQNLAKKGLSSISTTYLGVTYYFSSTTNKDLFISNPTNYEPQYGGWCAYAMGDNGKKVDIDPKTFKIINGKLYLFYNANFTNTLTSWNKNETSLKNKADKNWSSLYK